MLAFVRMNLIQFGLVDFELELLLSIRNIGYPTMALKYTVYQFK